MIDLLKSLSFRRRIYLENFPPLYLVRSNLIMDCKLFVPLKGKQTLC